MADQFLSGNVATISVAGVPLSDYVESVKFDRKAKSEAHHPLGSSPVVTLVHAPEFTIAIKGLIHPVPMGVFTSNLTSTPPSIEVVYEPQGPGGATRTCQARMTDYTEDTDGTKAGTFDASLVVDGAITDS